MGLDRIVRLELNCWWFLACLEMKWWNLGFLEMNFWWFLAFLEMKWWLLNCLEMNCRWFLAFLEMKWWYLAFLELNCWWFLAFFEMMWWFWTQPGYAPEGQVVEPVSSKGPLLAPGAPPDFQIFHLPRPLVYFGVEAPGAAKLGKQVPLGSQVKLKVHMHFQTQISGMKPVSSKD